MKSLLFLLGLSLPGLVPSAHACINGSVRENAAGSRFTCDTSNPLLGEAYRDSTGLIWGEAVKNADGSLRGLTYAEADRYCQSIGARVPTDTEVWIMLESMKDDFFLKGTPTDLIPDLTLSEWFWTSTSVNFSTRDPDGTTIVYAPQNNVYVVNGPRGHIPWFGSYFSVDSDCDLRCVAGLPPHYP